MLSPPCPSSPSTTFTGAPLRGIEATCGLCRRLHRYPLDAALGLRALSDWWEELSAPASRMGDGIRAARGKMVAALVGVTSSGTLQELRAISGNLFGLGDIPGCVPSVIRREATAAEEARYLPRLDDIRHRLPEVTSDEERRALIRERRALSRIWMKAINDAVVLQNRRGNRQYLPDIFVGSGIPSGTADCALPKLLHAANVAQLRVLGLAEAWFGPDLGDRRHGELAVPCTRRCAPILGYLVCDAP